LWGGAKKLASKGLNYAKQGAKWVGKKAGKAWSGVKSVGSSILGGAKKLASKGLNYAKQGAKWVGDKAGNIWSGAKKGVEWVGDRAKKRWNSIKSTGSSIWGGVKKGAKSFGERAKSRWSSIKSAGSSLWEGAKKGANWFGDRAKQRWDTTKSIGSSLWSGAKKVYNQGEKYTDLATKWSVKTAGSLIDQSEKIGSSIGSSVGSSVSPRTSSLALPSVSSISRAVNRENSHILDKPSVQQSTKQQKSSYSLVVDRANDEPEKYAEVNRSQSSQKIETKNSQSAQKGMDNQVDELSMKIFRHLRSEIALEFARSR